jgi:hypothetical protein
MIAELALITFGLVAAGGPATLDVDPPEVHLRGSDSRTQLVVTARDPAGRSWDVTEAVAYSSRDATVAVVDATGEVRPVADGTTEILVRTAGSDRSGAVAVRVVVEDQTDRRPVRFASDIIPVFTKVGCNAGSCHGKAGGQNGFRLSLLGADPRLDFESLVREDRGRRVFPPAPGESLVLRKPTGRLPHGGGTRFAVGSPEYRLIERWVRQGTPYGESPGAALTQIEVRPGRRVVARHRTQRLRVIARYADGSEADVTRLAQYQANQPDLVAVDPRGRVSTLDGVGDAAVMARFGGQVAVARITVPLGADAPDWSPPPARNSVDRFIFARLRELGIPPSTACSDAEFARRSSLDICGELPDPGAVAAFEADTDPEKRVAWVVQLLERPAYADRFAMTWSAILRNKRTLGPLSQPGTFAFHAWVRQAIAENLPYDRFAAAILTATGDAAENPPVVWFRPAATSDAQVDDTAQLFLGLRLQCARCHRHPFERWGPDDYYGFAALFSRVGRKPGPDTATPRIFVLPVGQATDPMTGRSYAPRLLGESSPLELEPGADPRQALADWLRRPDNPYFARAVVNRYWKHLFGRGLVEPEDDLRASNPPTHPDLLDTLAGEFVGRGFDLKWLVHTLATSRAYERSSRPNDFNRTDRQAFSRFLPRRLPAEVLLDAIGAVTGAPGSFPGLPPGVRAVQLPDEGFDSPGRFLDVFGRPKRETVCECERVSEPSLSQSLHLLNSPEIEAKVAHPSGRAARWEADPRPDADKVDELYRLAFSRAPTGDERGVCLAHLARRRAEGRARQGFEDLVWSVINTREFQFVQ